MAAKSLKVGNTAQNESIGEIVDRLLDELRSTYTKAICGLEEDRLALNAESEGLQKRAVELADVLPAKARMAAFAADALLAEGKPEESRAQREAQRELENQVPAMERRQQEIVTRIGEIAREEKRIARRCFLVWLPDSRGPLIKELGETVLALDKMWAGMISYAKDTGTLDQPGSIITAGLRADLTPREHGPEARLFIQLDDWFGSRQNGRK